MARFEMSGCDICVSDNFIADTDSCSCFGTCWSDSASANDTAAEYFFTGEGRFRVKEIEVFEIAD
jgi:hypothetical protein